MFKFRAIAMDSLIIAWRHSLYLVQHLNKVERERKHVSAQVSSAWFYCHLSSSNPSIPSASTFATPAAALPTSPPSLFAASIPLETVAINLF